MPNQDKAFWDAHGRVGLVWSNPDASDDVLIAAALLKQPNFHLLLDLITLLPKLPRAALKELERELKRDGHEITHQIDPDAYDDFQMSGLELADSQQNWIVDGVVKLTFFTAEPEHEKLLAEKRANETAKPNKGKEFF